MVVTCSPSFSVLLGRVLDLKASNFSIFSSLKLRGFILITCVWVLWLSYNFLTVHLWDKDANIIWTPPERLEGCSSTSLQLIFKISGFGRKCWLHSNISTDMRSSFTILKFLRNKLLLVINSNSCSACLWFKYDALLLTSTNGNKEGINGYSSAGSSLTSQFY